MQQTHVLRLAFAFLAYFSACHAALVNRTIDSNYGDPVTGFIPTYLSPSPIWADQTCAAWNPQTSTGCTIRPEPAKAFDGTWKSTTYLPSYKNINFTIDFVGIAVWVYFILANLNQEGDPYTNTNVNFTLDGQFAGNFSHEPNNNTYDLMYNQTVFSRTDLVNSPHTLIVSVNDYDRNTFVCFDWAMYTAELSDSNSTLTGSSSVTPTSAPTTSATSSATTAATSSSSNSQTAGIVAGSVIGGLALILIVVAAFIWNQKRQARQLKADGIHTSPTPFMHTSEPSQSLLPAGTKTTSERAGGSATNLAGLSREALSTTHRRDVSGTTGKRSEANLHFNSSSGSSEPAVEAPGSSQVVAELTSLSGQMQELRGQMEQLTSLRNLDGAPPAYM